MFKKKDFFNEEYANELLEIDFHMISGELYTLEIDGYKNTANDFNRFAKDMSLKIMENDVLVTESQVIVCNKIEFFEASTELED